MATVPYTINQASGATCQYAHIDVEQPLPKPQRVEKWQRWRGGLGEGTIAGIVGEKAHFGETTGAWIVSIKALLEGIGWHFLGYAKPDKVEVGQRWRNQGKEYAVESFSDGVANLGGTSHASIEAMLKEATFEYLGMAYREREGEIAFYVDGVEQFRSAKHVRQFVTLSDTQRRTLRHMLLEQRAQSEEEQSESLQGIASKAKLQGTLDLSANECATVLDTMPAFEVDHWIEVADLLKALKRG